MDTILQQEQLPKNIREELSRLLDRYFIQTQRADERTRARIALEISDLAATYATKEHVSIDAILTLCKLSDSMSRSARDLDFIHNL